jgi:hypothetical protein
VLEVLGELVDVDQDRALLARQRLPELAQVVR